MKKCSLVLLAVVALLYFPIQTQAQEVTNSGGVAGFFVGCCFGIRTAGQWNEGKDLHFRDWGRMIPFVSLVIAVWDGIDGAQGITTSDLQEQYGAQYF